MKNASRMVSVFVLMTSRVSNPGYVVYNIYGIITGVMFVLELRCLGDDATLVAKVAHIIGGGRKCYLGGGRNINNLRA